MTGHTDVEPAPGPRGPSCRPSTVVGDRGSPPCLRPNSRVVAATTSPYPTVVTVTTPTTGSREWGTSEVHGGGRSEGKPCAAGPVTLKCRADKYARVPLLRILRMLPWVLSPEEAARLLALRSRRNRAMVETMLPGKRRRCEVIGHPTGQLT